jgi:dipeptidyl aminopeptidase/acylaminoacyl peptidase
MAVRWLVAFVLCIASSMASAQAGQVTVEDLYRLPAYAGMEASRNGRYLATRIPVNGRMNPAIIEIESRTRITLTDYSDFDVVDVHWVGSDRLLYKLGRLDSPDPGRSYEGGGLFMISRDGKERARLSETRNDVRRQNQKIYRDIDFVRTLPNNDLEVMVRANLRDVDSFDLYRMNVVNGQTVLLTPDRPARTFRFVLDREREPRVAVASVRDAATEIVYFRRSAQAPWEELLRYEADKPGRLHPLSFDSSNRNLLVATNAGRDTMAVYRYDRLAKKLLDLVYENAGVDVGADASGGTAGVSRVFVDGTTDELLGVNLNEAKPSLRWLTEADRAPQRTVDKVLPGTYNTINRLRGDQYLITAQSDRSPTTWHLWDESRGTVEDMLASQPQLTNDRLVEQRSFTLKTRDGLEFPSYYFLPRNHKPGEKLPTVVHIHGGPAVRTDLWGSMGTGVREAQLLAARGYAVVLPNFRITPGFGNRAYYSGFGTLGRQMIDDHEDAALWAVQQGFADPQRICISGASYGGYATLMALARHPKTFKCGVAGLVVSDVPLQLTSSAGDFSSNDRAVTYWLRLAGVRSVRELPADISPVNLADRIKQPVFIYAGAEDLRTPLEQTTRMAEALTRAGNPPKVLLIKRGEGHGFGRPENRIELYSGIVKFLDEQIGASSRQ